MVYSLTLIVVEINFVKVLTLTKLLQRKAGTTPTDKSRPIRSLIYYWKKFHTSPKRTMKSRYG